jgi:hypothetical protein
VSGILTKLNYAARLRLVRPKTLGGRIFCPAHISILQFLREDRLFTRKREPGGFGNRSAAVSDPMDMMAL